MLILCNRDDLLCLALYKYLRSIHAPIQLVTTEELIHAQSWEHMLDEQGKTFTNIKLQNGHTISSSKLRIVFNRIRYLFMPHFINVNDRNYAELEMYALYVSFLRSINHLLIEPVETRHLSFDQDNTLFYFQKAVENHVPVLNYNFTSSPRMYPSTGLTPVAPPKSTRLQFPQKSPFLVWQNRPTLFLQPFTNLTTVYVIGGAILSDGQISFSKEIKDFVRSIGRTLVELNFAKTTEGSKMCYVNVFPQNVRKDIVKTLADLMVERYEKPK